MRLWWVLLVVAGCYAPTAPAGAPCADGRTCPDGLVCETVGGADVCILPGTLGPDAALDAPDGPATPDVPPPGDRDGDGVADEEDLCPELADDQHDEDADGLGDVCDPCPIFAQATDEDGDGLGDGCDPFPESDDRLAVFHGFGAQPPGWSSSDGWSFSEDHAVFASQALAVQYLTAPTPLTTPTIAVIAQIQIDELGVDGGIGVALVAGQTGVSCGFGNGGGTMQLILYDLDQAQSIAAVPIPSFDRTEPWAVFLVQTSDNEYQCAATNGTEQFSTPMATNSLTGALQASLVAGNTSAYVEFLLVTTSMQ